ncbi:MAG: thiopurine S-methyltransferase [Pseudomonadota bacterium]|jgi:thiopurine S-methyltransferase
MDPEFWHQRWQNREIGFHLDHPNPRLTQHWDALELPPGSRILVPLCGKSQDLAWLARRGHRVLGVELSPIAVAEFFAEHELQPQRLRRGPFESLAAGDIEILCGDFFALDRNLTGPIDAVYDRAALVALPEPLRRRYAEQIAELVPAGAQLLLVTFDYAQREMPGPPFAVGPEAVRDLYAAQFSIEHLAGADVLDAEPRFRERGLSALREEVFRLRRR